MENVSWVVGIDIGKEKLSCAVMDVKKVLTCRFEVESSLGGYNELWESRVFNHFLDAGSSPTGHWRRFFKGLEGQDPGKTTLACRPGKGPRIRTPR